MNEMDYEENNHNKTRIKVACEACRRKKVKCDGQYPCLTCNRTGGECIYKERLERQQKKAKKRKLNASTDDIMHLNSRLSKLEDMLSLLGDKISLGNVSSAEDSSENGSDDSDSSKADGSTTYKEEPVNHINSINESSKYLQSKQEMKDTSEDGESPCAAMDNITCASGENGQKYVTCASGENGQRYIKELRYVGTHSIFAVFSERSLHHIQGLLGCEGGHFVMPIRNIPILMGPRMHSLESRWVDPPIISAKEKKSILETPFQDTEKPLLFLILDTYYERNMIASSLCSKKYVKGLFEQYYKKDAKSTRKLKTSELLIMSISLCISFTAKLTDAFHKFQYLTESEKRKQKKVFVESLKCLVIHYDKLFDNCIFYYHRISVINEGIETVEAILMLSLFLKLSSIASHSSYILVSVATRFAQELGLDRSFDYLNMSEEENFRRKNIWWYCFALDMEACFKDGKPPLIDDLEASLNFENDLISNMKFIAPSFKEQGMPQKLNGQVVAQLAERHGLKIQNYYYFMIFSKLKSKSYRYLFAPVAETFSFDDILEKIEQLDQEMNEIANGVPFEVRPRLYNDPNFRSPFNDLEPAMNEFAMVLQFSYFGHLMIINRVPSNVDFKEKDVQRRKILNFRKISLDSARTILILVKNLQSINFNALIFNWIIVMPFVAFSQISAACMNHPNDPQTRSDLKLLIECSLNFFSNISSIQAIKLNFMSFPIMDHSEIIGLVAKLLLRVTLKIYQNATGYDFISHTPGLEEHLNQVQKKYPSLFDKELQPSVMKFMGDCFFDGLVDGNRYNNKTDTSKSASGQLPGKGTTPNSYRSPSYEPFNPMTAINSSIALSNILQRADGVPVSNTSSPSSNTSSIQTNTFPSNGLSPYYPDDDNLTSLFYTDMSNLPNIFYDNNLDI
ncbi:Piso0_005504 [Millerozyma farinosa CBS 7064]|uniref:Piso0_005504 protein n=1 Tax=Pichia sorbitophila (strain ATCC MYA-4447 / BCRC 22081 / CBS 7064 / NBRC 10061 / NRRL Y-12695) TaxID=559304 RepID=G8Y257_PICSO|nr:Piso0_005504 [Millerozyma farinosa CBS 7064]